MTIRVNANSPQIGVVHGHTEGAGKVLHTIKKVKQDAPQGNTKAGGKLNKKHFVIFEMARKREGRRKQTKRARYYLHA